MSNRAATPLAGDVQTESTEGTAPMSDREHWEAEIARDPRVAEPWLQLLALANEAGDLSDIRTVYDRFFEYFPQASAQWIEYIELELAHSNFIQVDDIFTRCLRSTLSIDLWKLYLSYTRRVNPLPALCEENMAEREKTRQVLENAYEFALKFVGWDRDSGELWQDYLQLVREREAQGSWQEGQKMDQLRRIYQRAVTVPLNNVEAIWREYDAYENSLSKLTAKKFLAERSPAYMQARSVLREMKQLMDPLVFLPLPRQPGWLVPNGRTAAQERKALQAWHRYLAWEEKNPLGMDDASALQHRVLCAYKKALQYIRFDPVVWYMAATYCETTQRHAERLVWLRNGISACPWSLLLRFTYAEACVSQGQYADATAALDDLVVYTQHQMDARLQSLERALTDLDAKMQEERKRAQQQREEQENADDDDADKAELADVERKWHEKRDKLRQQLVSQAEPGLELWRATVTQTWVKYMHFVRRAEGIRPMRQLFGRARKSPHCTWQVYEASALLEYHCAKEPTVATKVFELALKTFGANEHLVVRYLDFLLSINDDTNARAVLERTVNTMPADKAKIVWTRWAEYEYSFGDAGAVSRLEARLRDTYPTHTKVEWAADRLRYHALDSVRALDLGFMQAPKVVAPEADTESDEPAPAKEVPASGKGKGGKEAPKTESTGGRQTMEDIRRSLVSSAEPVKRTRAKADEKPAKKAKNAAAEALGRRGGPRDTPPPPPPPLPDAILYFMRCVACLTAVSCRRP